MGPISLDLENTTFAYFEHKYTTYKIFNYPEGINTKILTKVFDQMEVMLTYYSKVSIIFLQLNLNKSYKPSATVSSKLVRKQSMSISNEHISECMKLLTQKLEQLYPSKVGFAWVRERVSSVYPHYHIVIMLNGNKCESAYNIQKIAKEYWLKLTGGSVWNVDNPFYCMTRENDHESRTARARSSYLAKNITKDGCKKYRSFAISRLKINPKFEYEP